jgi:hypothetical protein
MNEIVTTPKWWVDRESRPSGAPDHCEKAAALERRVPLLGRRGPGFRRFARLIGDPFAEAIGYHRTRQIGAKFALAHLAKAPLFPPPPALPNGAPGALAPTCQ